MSVGRQANRGRTHAKPTLFTVGDGHYDIELNSIGEGTYLFFLHTGVSYGFDCLTAFGFNNNNKIGSIPFSDIGGVTTPTDQEVCFPLKIKGTSGNWTVLDYDGNELFSRVAKLQVWSSDYNASVWFYGIAAKE